MKSIAEKEFPLLKYKYNNPEIDDINEIRIVQHNAYTLACTHWAAFMEWALTESFVFHTANKIWYSDGGEDIMGDGMTTTELFEYWYNNVKDKP